MKVSDFDFELPREFIAQRPVTPRDASKLLRVDAGFSDHIFRELPDLLQPGDMLVFNDTKVIPARLFGKRGEAKVEITLHKRETLDTWRVFAKGAKKLRIGDQVDFADGFSARVLDKSEAGDVGLQFDRPGEELMAALENHGGMPLPPYIKREGLADEQDKFDYQTMFAREKGAVAAPTAGLHFTQRVLDGLEARGIKTERLTLHVGAGTFLPVKVEDVADHQMHAEYGLVTQKTVEAILKTKAEGGRIVACGTTSLRLLEAASQSGDLKAFDGETDIFITPGFKFHTADLLMTNFHLPASTLFMLVSAFSGFERMKAAYAYAMDHDYRFYSYGDASLLSREDLIDG